jgi:hypothetical protein
MRPAKVGLFTALVAACLARAHDGRADEALSDGAPTPTDAFELKLNAGYTQGLGKLAPGTSVGEVSGAGLGLGLDVDYRIFALLSVGVAVQYQEFTTGQNEAARGMTLDLGATYHFSPERGGDPWVRLGTGYRLLWDVEHRGSNGPTNLFHGIDLAVLRVGYDVRVSQDVSVSPLLGADFQVFLWENATPLRGAFFATFLYAGLQVRFESGPSSTGGLTVASWAGRPGRER